VVSDINRKILLLCCVVAGSVHDYTLMKNVFCIGSETTWIPSWIAFSPFPPDFGTIKYLDLQIVRTGNNSIKGFQI